MNLHLYNMKMLAPTNKSYPYEIPQADLEFEDGLSLPRILWCPECGVHARHQDQRTMFHRLLAMCPVCQDIKDKEKASE